MRNDGGSAFPTFGNPEIFTGNGMSLRDYFAAAALTGIISKHAVLLHVSYDDIAATAQCNARGAYAYADAMLAERDNLREQTPVTEADREQGATDMERAYPHRRQP